MEIFRLEKAIENEKLDLEMALVQLKEEKEHLSQSLKRSKELARQMNDHQYIEEKIEEQICAQRPSYDKTGLGFFLGKSTK